MSGYDKEAPIQSIVIVWGVSGLNDSGERFVELCVDRNLVIGTYIFGRK